MKCPNCKLKDKVRLITHSGKYDVPSNYLGYHCFRCGYGFAYYAVEPNIKIDPKSKNILYNEMVND